MAEKDQPQTTDEEAQRVDYAFWDIPGESFRVVYSLQLFHEIDFVVNEGYRKVPHGGIETAGLLFGSVTASEVRIEAFRPIECEHASGPSLNFSENDLSGLAVQLQESGQDRNLADFKPIGWFLGHTRGPLELSEAEAMHFERFFPKSAGLTVLVKPERFQPTRFGFLVRRANGEMPRDAISSAVILPLPGRSYKPGQLVPSIPAPNPIAVKRSAPVAVINESPSEQDRVAETRHEPKPQRKLPAEPRKSDEPSLDSIWKIPPSQEEEKAEEERVEQEKAEELTAAPAANRAERRRLARERTRLIEEAYPYPVADTPPTPPAPPPMASAEIAPFRPQATTGPPAGLPPSLPMDLVRYIPSAYDRYPGSAPNYDEDTTGRSLLSGRSITALALAALLGCLVGYLAYLQLPSPVIPIDVRPIDQTIIVSWPPEETRNAVYAAIRLNDGAPVPLSAQEKKTGHVSLSAARDFKVEIVARNWIRDSRGIVRYLHSNNGNGVATPLDLPPTP